MGFKPLIENARAAYKKGDLESAGATCARILSEDPSNFDALKITGAISFQRKEYLEAVKLFTRGTELRPNSFEVYQNLGSALKESGDLLAAVEAYRKSISLNPKLADAHRNLGITLSKLDRTEEARSHLDTALQLKPDFAQAFFDRGKLFQASKDLLNALEDYNRAIDLRPDWAPALVKRFEVLSELARLGETHECAKRLVEIAPNAAQSYYTLAFSLRRLGRYGEALTACERALAIKADYIPAVRERAHSLNGLGQMDEAISSYDHAIFLEPDNKETLFDRSLAYLKKGSFSIGWVDYELRWLRSDPPYLNPNWGLPQWRGQHPIAGKTLVVTPEQGHGDNIQACRYLPALVSQGVNVVLFTHKPLSRLFKTLPGVSQVKSGSDQVEIRGAGSGTTDNHFHCPIMSLPLACEIGLNISPPTVPYLSCPPADVDKWSRRLGPQHKPRIGVMWAGGSNVKFRGRSISLSLFCSLFADDFEWISLAKDIRDIDQEAFSECSSLRHFGYLQTDFMDAAALCELVDLVITVDTSIAHLAGALGRPVWILLPKDSDWRWMLGRDDTPLYPTARLFRQSNQDDWGEVLERVTQALEQRFEAHREPPKKKNRRPRRPSP